MKVKDLIRQLEQFSPDLEVAMDAKDWKGYEGVYDDIKSRDIDKNEDFAKKVAYEDIIEHDNKMMKGEDFQKAKELGQVKINDKKMITKEQHDIEMGMVTSKSDPINHPSHYNQGNIEIIDFLEDQSLNYRLSCVIKYVCRCEYKGTKLSDLKKARWYLEREIRLTEKELENE